ncbi:hypothetical protein WJX81_005751 [Elliptochloris bilobata]|uniref:BPL/LPL catalytic domain-containing protein n=1 Tax=Elliptochloris bilobata TaxID=381761 RepID=A0AAW1RN02_9CHLO
MAGSSPGAYTVHLHARTPEELQTSRQRLAQGELVTSKSQPGSSLPVHVQVGPAAAGKAGPGLDADAYFGALQTRALGGVLLAAAELPSTQTLLQDNAALVPDGAVAVANRQVAGKGRGQNRWTSPDGCLMFSVCTELDISGVRLPFVQYVASLAVVHAIQEQARARLQGASLDVRIKWPNDLYAGGLKLGGVLCHSVYRARLFATVTGVGLNLANTEPTTCVDALIAARHAELALPGAAAPVPREALLAGIMGQLEAMLGVLAAQGFDSLQAAYLDAWLHSGQQVELEEHEGGDGAMRRVSLTVQGLTPGGYLLATDAAGKGFELHPDGNSLDFFQGLVRRKALQ